MNYTDIKNTALAYSNRGDADLLDNMDSFIRMVEARINRSLRVQKQAKRALIQMADGQEYYGLPSDFSGLRDIESRAEDDETKRSTLQYRNPEQFSSAVNAGMTSSIYTIVADQIQVWPTVEGNILEIVYYATLPPLGTTTEENWLSKLNPDVYVFGLLVEISAFAKDSESATLWNTRLLEALQGLETRDQKDRWSGTSLQIHIG